MDAPLPRLYTFGDFRIDALARRLNRLDGAPVVLTARVFDTLLYLVRHPGILLGKDEMLAAIWPGRVVEENNLTQSISELRKVLGAEANGYRYIATEPGRGYRFVVDVHPEPPAAAGSSIVTAEAIAVPAAVALESPDAHGTRVAIGPARRLALAAVLLIALIGAGILILRNHPASVATTPITTVAVLPFKPLLAADRDEVLELGMADTLIAKLSSNRRLVVRSLGSVRKFDAIDQDPLAAAHELAVGSVLEGEVQRRNDRVHVSARLLSAPAGTALWSGTFDENVTDVFSVQDAIAQRVAAALALSFDSAEQRAMRAGYTRNADAYLLYLAGRYRIGKVTPSEIRSGMESFRKAIDLDPTFALAHAALAEAYRRLPITSDVDPKDAFPLAKAAADKALEIDGDLAEAHSVLGWVAFWYDWDWAAAEQEFRRAIELNPSVAEAHLGYGHLLSNAGRDAEAVVQGELAHDLDPLSSLVNVITAGFLANAHRPDEARARIAKVLEMDPHFWIAHLMRGGMALGAHDYPMAIAELTRAEAESGGSMQATSMLGYTLAKSGDRAGAEVVLKRMLDQVGQRYVPATSIATVYIGLGDTENAISWLQRAYDERDVRMAFIGVDQRWDPLRKDARFVALAERIGKK